MQRVKSNSNCIESFEHLLFTEKEKKKKLNKTTNLTQNQNPSHYLLTVKDPKH